MSRGGVLGAPTLSYGKLEDVRGLKGEETLARLTLDAQAADAGGPAMTQDGSVIGMLLPRGDSMVQLPPQVNFVARGDAMALDGLDRRAQLAQFDGRPLGARRK